MARGISFRSVLLAAAISCFAAVTPVLALQQPSGHPEGLPAVSAPVSDDVQATLVPAVAGAHPILARPITIDLRNVPLETALASIAALSDVAIAFSNDAVSQRAPVTMRVANQELGEVLRSIVAARSLDLLVSKGGLLVVVPRQEEADAPSLAGDVSGSVIGPNGEPVAGATVNVLGTTRISRTDAAGRFAFAGLPAGTRALRAYAGGVLEGSLLVSVASGATSNVSVRLIPRVIRLEEIVAIGYGSARRRNLTGAVASVVGDMALVKAAPTASVADALQGRAPGVHVISNSGAPGGGASVRIRGSNSISANSEPLYVVDGIPFGQGSAGTDNPLASIDPKNIESIQVLKDASATAIYGTRGANGVVLIMTKRGLRDGTRVEIESSFGIQSIVKDIDVLDSQQFMTMANEANLNAGRLPRYTQADIDTAQTFDYLDMVLRPALQQNHSLTFTGGDANSQFLISGNYLGQDGVLIETEFERYGARVNLDRLISSRLRLGTSLSGTYTVQRIGGGEDGGFNGGVVAALNFAPYVPPKDANGNWNKLAVTSDQTGNPVANQMEIENPQRATNILSSVVADFDIRSNLRLRSMLAGNFGFESNLMFAPRTVSAGGIGGVASRDERQGREITNDNTLTYLGQIGSLGLEAMGGLSIQRSHRERTQAGAQNFPTDEFGYNNLGAGAQISTPQSSVIDWTLLSYLGRVNFSLLDRYLLTVTARRDGSSRFGANNKWATFPSAAFAWRLVDEPFLRDHDYLTDLKLRLSYGRTGNQAVDEYSSLAQLTTGTLGMGATPSPIIILTPASRAPNPDLTWETQTQLNVGVDASFLADRVSLSLDAYHTRTSDLLLQISLPALSGYSSQLKNIGSVKNQGFEFSVSTVNVDASRFGWRTTLNLSTNRNEVLDIGEQPRIVVGSFLIEPGKPLSTIFGYKVLGLYQQGDSCPLVATNDCAPGEYKVQDTDGNGTINNSDRVVLGHADPDLYGGFNSGMTFGRISLDALFNFSFGNEVVNITKQRNSLVRGVYNERIEVLDRWTPSNRDTNVPRANANRPNLFYSTLVEDASYLRFQTLTLGYHIPERLLPFSDAARVYLTGQNVWLATGYDGFDPEVNINGGDARQRGLDNNGIPRPRVWNLGVSLTF